MIPALLNAKLGIREDYGLVEREAFLSWLSADCFLNNDEEKKTKEYNGGRESQIKIGSAEKLQS